MKTLKEKLVKAGLKVSAKFGLHILPIMITTDKVDNGLKKMIADLKQSLPKSQQQDPFSNQFRNDLSEVIDVITEAEKKIAAFSKKFKGVE